LIRASGSLDVLPSTDGRRKIFGVAKFGSCTLRHGAAHVDGFGHGARLSKKASLSGANRPASSRRKRCGNTGTMDQLKARHQQNEAPDFVNDVAIGTLELTVASKSD
jgi:hypothetical protein